MAKKQLKVKLVPAIKRLEITIKKLVGTSILGGYKSAFKGKGLEFEEYREYRPDIDASRIDWKASARSDHLLFKQYQEERNLNVFFLIDVSDKMVFGSTNKLKNEYTAELVASLSYLILQAGDRIGFSMFTDKPITKMRPGGGMKQFYALSRELVNPNNYGGKFDLDAAMDFVLNFIEERTFLIIVSDFIGLEQGWEESFKVASKKYDIAIMIVRDPRDLSMPSEDMLIALSNPVNDEQLLFNPKEIKLEYEKMVRLETKKVEDEIAKLGLDYILLSTDKSFVTPIMAFFRKRYEKWR